MALDIGASTGGFTDCMLQRGARRVYAIDSGEGQLHPRLRADSRVVNIEKCNARALQPSQIGEPAALAVMDVSFISQTLILPALSLLLPSGAHYIGLVKPQFEVGRDGLGKGGIVKDDRLRRTAVDRVIRAAAEVGLSHLGTIDSPILGKDGNHEFLSAFIKE